MSRVSPAFIVRVVSPTILIVIGLVALVPGVLTLVGRSDVADGQGGDFPAFYAAGRIVLEGGIDDLYDGATQRSYQSGLHETDTEFLYFAYPPVVAVAFAAIAWMPYGVALSVYSLVSMAALIGAIAWILPHRVSPYPRRAQVLAGCAAAVVAYPVLASLLGGQNTTFTILLVGLAWSGVINGQPALAGLAAAGTLYKPQYGLLVLLAVALTRSRRVVGWAMGGALAFYGANAVIAGWGWLAAWLEQVQLFNGVNRVANGWRMINAVGWFQNLIGDPTGSRIGWILAVVVALVGIWFIWRCGPRSEVFAGVTAWIIFVSPSSLFYDFGLVVVGTLVVVLAGDGRLAIGVAIIGATWIEVFAPNLGWSPTFVLLVIVLIAAMRQLLSSTNDSVSYPLGTLAARSRTRE
ncbi:glycosyltransferase family 87 protein [Actinomycetota bacterium]